MLTAFTAFGAFAQLEELPLDPAVRTGQLENGLTYYIRHNETPKGQADFYIAQKVGSILENDSQRGLAHFLEHMCFNGTTNFPGTSLRDWLESVGVKFGVNLNAHTGVDETVYNISNVPTARESVQDSCLLILHDWADEVSLLGEEIDKERPIIHEEWRTNNVGQMRILEKLLPKMYPGSKYGHRLPIGIMEVVDSFPHQVLRDYYEAWYRPDQQGIIVVGDIDVDRIENKIKEMFGPIKMPQNAQPREYEKVPQTEGTIYAIGTDKEQSFPIFNIFFKNEAMPREQRNTMAYMVTDYITDMIGAMLNNRFSEMMSDPNVPFAQAYADYGNYLLANTEDALTLGAVAKGGDMIPSYKAVYRELLRAQKGFTVGEYDRARSEYLSRLEKAYNNREKQENDVYVQELVRHFIDNNPAPGIEMEYNNMNLMANNIPVEAINQVFQQMVSKDNRVLLAMLPEKEGMKVPTEQDFITAAAEVEAEDIQPYKDEVKTEPLIPQLPAPGKIVSEQPVEKWGATKYTLSNGVDVIVKQTDFKADEILFDAMAKGGTSVFPDEYSNSLIFFPIASTVNGLGDYTNKDLQKYLSGKQVGVEMSFSDFTRDVEGQSTPKDLPTLMELIYMYFTNFTINPDEFESTRQSMIGVLKNQENNPQFVFQQDLMKALYSAARKQALSTDAIAAADLNQTIDIARKMTANAADYTFYFVGNIDMDTFKPLMEQYLATLPADAATKTSDFKCDPALALQTAQKTHEFTTKMETPQTYAAILEVGSEDFTPANRALATTAGQILSQRLINTVREEMGAVYSIWAQGNMSRLNNGHNITIQSTFPMKPEKKQEVFDFISKEFKNMETNITDEEVNKVIEYSIKNVREGMEKNDAWLNAMGGEYLNGVDTFNGAEELFKSITKDDVMKFMKDLNAQGKYLIITLDPLSE